MRAIQADENGQFNMGVLPDGVGVRFNDEPLGTLNRTSNNVQFELLALLSPLATASITYNEPSHVARKFGLPDHICGGWEVWNVVTKATDIEACNFNLDGMTEKLDRYHRATEFVDVLRKLWDSWENDASIREKASGPNYEPAGLHVLNDCGEHFWVVEGPLT